MLIDNIVAESAELVTVEGYLKGNCVHSNQLLHLTGFDDYEIEKIEIKMDHGKTKRHAKG